MESRKGSIPIIEIDLALSSPLSSSLETTTTYNPPIASTSKLLQDSSTNSTFSIYRTNLRTALNELVSKFKERRSTTLSESVVVSPLEESIIEEEVEKIMERVGKASEDEVTWRLLVRKSSVDRALEQILYDIALYPDESTATNYGLLTDVMDVILTFAEREYADANLPLTCLGGLCDLQTIAGCHPIFDYIESRRERLLKNMNPTQGKGPLLLRLLNELLRRLPKSNSADVIFSGRILMFLSSAFPLAEKSGVNLRGNFNIGKGSLFEIVKEEVVAETTKDEMEVDKVEGAVVSNDSVSSSKEFYNTFWGLQTYFNNPPVLFTTPPNSKDDPFKLLQNGITKTLEAFAAATAKEKRLLGAGGADGTKKVSGNIKLDSEEEVKEHYFFPKFLTSPNLLDLEIADSSFRRQILVQIMVLFQYLLSFTPEVKARDQLISSNASALLSHVLTPANEKWINELRSKTLLEMESMQTGRPFSNTVELILAREQNWINWKIKSCLPYEKPALDVEVQSKLARQKLTQVTRKPKNYPYNLGNSALDTLWRKNTTSLDGFKGEASEENFDQLYRDWKRCKKVMEQKETLLKRLEENKVAADAPKIASLKNELEEGDKKLKVLHWRAIRIASTTHLHLFKKIGEGSLDLLVTAIEDEIRVKEKLAADLLNPPPVQEEEAEVVDIKEEEGEEGGSNDQGGVEEAEVLLEGQEEEEVLESLVQETARVDESESTTTILAPEAEEEGEVASNITQVAKAPGTPKRTREDDVITRGDEGDEEVIVVEGEKEPKRLKLDQQVSV